MIKLLFVTIISGFCIGSFAHEGHDMPGSLPPPPHGGRIGEAAHHEKHDSEEHKEDEHGKADHSAEEKESAHEEAELFIEAKLEGTILKLYPLSLEPKNNKVFKLIPPSLKLEISELKIEMPRSKKSKVLTTKVEKELWVADIGFIKDKRILVFATISQENEKKTAKIQLER